MHVGTLVDDDQGPLELAEVLGVHAEVGLQRDGAVDALRHVNEGATGPHGGVQRGELVITERDGAGEVLTEELGLLPEGGVGVEEQHSLLAELLVDLVVGVLDVGRKVLPGLGLTLLGAHEVLDLVEVDRADVDAPGRHRLAPEELEGLETHVKHPLRLMLHGRDAAHDILGQSALRSCCVGIGVVPAVFVAAEGSQVFVLAGAGAREACGGVNLGHE